MFIRVSASTVGSVSGGCLENDVLEHASEVIRTGKPCVIHYDTTTESDLVFGSGMGCGGTVDILLEPAMSAPNRRLIHYVEKCITDRQPITVGTVFSISGEVGVDIGDKAIYSGGQTEIIGVDNQYLNSEIERELRRVFELREGGNRRFDSPNGVFEMFFEYFRPPIALVIFGAGDDAIPVCRMASEVGWQVTVVDHRSDRATKERFPEANKLNICQPVIFRETMELTDYDAAVVMTHNYQHDLELLSCLLKSDLRYIGLLGASKRAERILNAVTTRGLHIEETMLNRLRAPIGLDLKAEGADEIALAVVAEIQMVLAGGTGQSLNAKRQPFVREEVHAKGNG